MNAKVECLQIRGEVSRWRALGLTVTDDGTIPLIGTSLQLVSPTAPEADLSGKSAITGWALSGVTAPGESASEGLLIDGLPTTIVPAGDPIFAAHELTASGLDHVVIQTSDLERTSTAISELTGSELKRIREVGSMRQGFHRIGRGGLVVELVERPEVPEGPASFWGFVINVDDLDLACERLGTDQVSAPKDAVQPGRRIATIRKDVGLGIPIALMST